VALLQDGRLMRLVLIGPPGSGKGTQARLLVEQLGLAYIGTGDILRKAISDGTPMGKRVEPLMKEGLLVKDEDVNEVVAELFRGNGRPEQFVTDGYPRTLAQAHAFDALLRQQYLHLDAVIHFEVSDEEVIRRMCGGDGRKGRDREDDKEETARRRLAEYHKTTDALLDYYRKRGLVKDIPATGTPEEVYALVIKALGKESRA
jgi:adenylate kinase